MSILTVGSIPGGDNPQIPDPSFRGRTDAGLQPPVANICLRTCAFAPRTCIQDLLANMRLCAYARASRPGSFGSHGHRIDFCGSAAFYQSCYLSIDAVRNNNWSFSYCSAQRRCLNSTIGKTLRSSYCSAQRRCLNSTIGKTLRSRLVKRCAPTQSST